MSKFSVFFVIALVVAFLIPCYDSAYGAHWDSSGNISGTSTDFIFSFDTGGWVDNKSGTDAAINRSIFKHGTGSILLNVGDPIASHSITKSNLSLQLKPIDVLTIWVYFPEEYKDVRVSLWLQQKNGWNNKFALTLGAPSDKGWAGWTPIHIPASKLIPYGAATWSEPVTAATIWLGTNATKNARAYINSIFLNTHGAPQVVWTFDDGGITDYTEAFFTLASKGMVGTSFIVSSFVGNKVSLSLPEMQQMYDAGWDFGNHSVSHPLFEKISSERRVKELTDCSSWLIRNGFGRSAMYLGYPGSGYSGAQPDVEKAGIVAARTSSTDLAETETGMPNPYRLPTGVSLKIANSVAYAKSRIEEAISAGKTCIIMGHDLGASPSPNGWTVADFRELADYVAERQRANLLSVKTFREWVIENAAVEPFPSGLKSDVPIDAVIESEPVSVTAYGTATRLPVQVSNGEYAVSTDGSTWGEFTSSAGLVAKGDRIKVRHRTSALPSTLTTTLLVVAGNAAPFATITKPVPVVTPWLDYPPTSSSGTITVRWENVLSDATYVVEQSTDGRFLESTEVYRGTATSATLTGRCNGSYYYRVKAQKMGYLDSPWRNGTRACTVTLKVATPWIDYPASSSTGSIQIRWDMVQTGAMYVVEQSQDAVFSTTSEVYSGTGSSVVLTGRGNGTYYYRVKATKAGYLDSNWRQGTRGCSVALRMPAPWIDFPATTTTGTVLVRFEPLQPGTTYVLEESQDPVFSAAAEVSRGPSSSVSLNGRGNGTYYYRVKTTMPGYLDSAWCNGARACTVSLKLATPWIDYPSASSTGDVKIRWEAVQPGTIYVVQESRDVSFSAATEVHRGTGTMVILTGRDNGAYYYRVKASKEGYLDSNWRSGSKSCNVLLKMPSPWIDYPTSNSTGSFQVRWEPVRLEATYVVEESTDASFSATTVVYAGPATSVTLAGRGSSPYYYQVLAKKSGFVDSNWRQGTRPCFVTR